MMFQDTKNVYVDKRCMMKADTWMTEGDDFQTDCSVQSES
jgi:hypothetical protein